MKIDKEIFEKEELIMLFDMLRIFADDVQEESSKTIADDRTREFLNGKRMAYYEVLDAIGDWLLVVDAKSDYDFLGVANRFIGEL